MDAGITVDLKRVTEKLADQVAQQAVDLAMARSAIEQLVEENAELRAQKDGVEVGT